MSNENKRHQIISVEKYQEDLKDERENAISFAIKFGICIAGIIISIINLKYDNALTTLAIEFGFFGGVQLERLLSSFDKIEELENIIDEEKSKEGYFR